MTRPLTYKTMAELGDSIAVSLASFTLVTAFQGMTLLPNGSYGVTVGYQRSKLQGVFQKTLEEFDPRYGMYADSDGMGGVFFGWVELTSEEFCMWELKYGKGFER